MNRHTLLLITPYFPPEIGGLESYAFNIVKRLYKKYGWNIVVITSFRGKDFTTIKEELVEGMKIYRLPTLFTISNTPINPLWLFWIRKIIKTTKPDLINVHSPVPFISDVACLVSSNIPVVLTYHAGTMRKGKILPDLGIGFYETFLLPLMIRKAYAIICSSKFVQRTIFNRITKETTVIHPAVDTEQFKPILNKDYSEKNVLFIGRYANMYRMKGLYYLIDAIKSTPGINLRIVGETLDIEDSQVMFVGLRYGLDLIREIQSCSLLVLPSLAHMESFGMVLVEAMACGIPVIGTNIGGIPEVINDGVDGLIVPSEDSKALAQAIRKILGNPTVAKSMGVAGRKKVVEEYSWDTQTQKTHDLFINTLKI